MKIAGDNAESVTSAEKISIHVKNKHHLETFLSVHIKCKVYYDRKLLFEN